MRRKVVRMIRWRSWTAKLSLLTGLCAWLVVSFVAIVHEVVIQHVVCAEHGEVLELDTAIATDIASKTAGPNIRAAGTDLAEEHGCAFEMVFLEHGVVGAPIPTLNAWSAPQAGFVATAHAPRGPPLAYAPKTDPPLSFI